MNIDPKEFRPKVNAQSDFFSWQLFRWLKKHNLYTEVYKAVWNPVTGYGPQRPTLFIGHKDSHDSPWFHGRQLRNLCIRGNGLDMFAYGGAHHVNEWEDVTEWFWNEYRRIGVCAIHGDYAHKWIELYPTKRKCEYCGKIETKKEVRVTREVWS